MHPVELHSPYRPYLSYRSPIVVKVVTVVPPAIRDIDTVGMFPRKSKTVCVLTTPLENLPKAYSASLMLQEVVVESIAKISHSG